MESNDIIWILWIMQDRKATDKKYDWFLHIIKDESQKHFNSKSI